VTARRLRQDTATKNGSHRDCVGRYGLPARRTRASWRRWPEGRKAARFQDASARSRSPQTPVAGSIALLEKETVGRQSRAFAGRGGRAREMRRNRSRRPRLLAPSTKAPSRRCPEKRHSPSHPALRQVCRYRPCRDWSEAPRWLEGQNGPDRNGLARPKDQQKHSARQDLRHGQSLSGEECRDRPRQSRVQSRRWLDPGRRRYREAIAPARHARGAQHRSQFGAVLLLLSGRRA